MKEKKEILGRMWTTGIYEDVNGFLLTGESRKSSLSMELNKTDLAKNVSICGHVDVSAIKVLPGTGFDMVEAPEIYELKKLLVEYVLNQNKKS